MSNIKNGGIETPPSHYLHSHHILCIAHYKKQLPPEQCIYCQLIERVLYEERKRYTRDPFQ